MSWLQKIIPNRLKTSNPRRVLPDNIWTQCPKCNTTLYRSALKEDKMVCSSCAYHLKINARERAKIFFDDNQYSEMFSNLKPTDFLNFKDTKTYKDRLSQAQKKTGEDDALLVFKGKLKNQEVIAVIFNFDFLGGSMGSVVGEKFVRAVNLAIADNLALICFTSSGGARMQESLLSLMQMAKTSAALTKLSEKKIPYIVVLTDPTTGGVSASLAMLGDIQFAEPGALICFAGPRVIEQTVREKLPDGFQRSEFLLEKGVIDIIVDRRNLRKEISAVLNKLTTHL